MIVELVYKLEYFVFLLLPLKLTWFYNSAQCEGKSAGKASTKSRWRTLTTIVTPIAKSTTLTSLSKFALTKRWALFSKIGTFWRCWSSKAFGAKTKSSYTTIYDLFHIVFTIFVFIYFSCTSGVNFVNDSNLRLTTWSNDCTSHILRINSLQLCSKLFEAWAISHHWIVSSGRAPSSSFSKSLLDCVPLHPHICLNLLRCNQFLLLRLFYQI